MNIDFFTFSERFNRNIAWKLLRAPNASLILTVLYQAFDKAVTYSVAESDLIEIIQRILEQSGLNNEVKKTPLEYLNDWSNENYQYLRKAYRDNGYVEAYYDMTPDAQKALNFVKSLQSQSFAGTESKLYIFTELLKKITLGTSVIPQEYLSELEKQKQELEIKIAQAKRGIVPKLDDTEIKSNYMQCMSISQEISSDFRIMQSNFKHMLREFKLKILNHDGTKGEIINEFLGNTDYIKDSDQGKSFTHFRKQMLDGVYRDEFKKMVGKLENVRALKDFKQANGKLANGIYEEWFEGFNHVLHCFRQVNAQLKIFVANQYFIKNKIMMDRINSIELMMLKYFEGKIKNNEHFMSIELPKAKVNLPLDRKLYNVKEPIELTKTSITDNTPLENEVDLSPLYEQISIDKRQLEENIREVMGTNQTTTLKNVIDHFKVEHGIEEVLTYIAVARNRFKTVVDENIEDEIEIASDILEDNETTNLFDKLQFLDNLNNFINIENDYTTNNNQENIQSDQTQQQTESIENQDLLDSFNQELDNIAIENSLTNSLDNSLSKTKNLLSTNNIDDIKIKHSRKLKMYRFIISK